VWDINIKKSTLLAACALGIAFNLLPQLDALAQVTSSSDTDCDFSDYTPAVIRNIRRNWRPTDFDRLKRVVVIFHISSDGSLLNAFVKDSSNSASADAAALTAVQRSAPFKAFPLGCKANDLPLSFTFGYQAVGGKNQQ